MSATPACPPPAFPLALEFVSAGSQRGPYDGLVHIKTLPYTIIAQATEGAYEVRSQGRHERIPEGGAFVVPADTPVEITHWSGRSRLMSARWVHLRFSYLGLFDFLSLYETPLRLPEKAALEAGHLIGRFLEHSLRENAYPDQVLATHDLASTMLRLICGTSRPKDDGAPAVWMGHRLYPVLLHIRQNLAGAVDIASLACLSGLSPSRFAALFKRELGVSPMAYVRNVRLEAARRRLVAGDETLSEVALATGFADAFHLSHVFTARFGLSPKLYRQRTRACLEARIEAASGHAE